MATQSKGTDYFTHWPAVCLTVFLGIVILVPVSRYLSHQFAATERRAATQTVTADSSSDRENSKHAKTNVLDTLSDPISPWRDEVYARERLFGRDDPPSDSRSPNASTEAKQEKAKDPPDAADESKRHWQDAKVVSSMRTKVRPFPSLDDEFWAPLNLQDEETLRRDLREFAITVDLAGRDGQSVTIQDIRSDIRRSKLTEHSEFGPGFHPIEQWIAGRNDLEGLPLRRGRQCQLDEQSTKSLAELSRTIGICLQDVAGDSLDPAHDDKVAKALQELEVVNNEDAARVLHQMLQAEGTSIRLHLVARLSAIDGGVASDALAQRAMFDLSPMVREAAIHALQRRPRLEFYPQLVDGMRYPWPPVANHAAAALVVLDVEEAVESLIVLKDAPNPLQPVQDEYGHWHRVELVRVNHMRNCYLCHAPSIGDEDLVRGLVPIAGRHAATRYYGSFSPGDMLVRADVTYLKQDFSVTHHDESYQPWPTDQQHDYLVRKRRFSDTEQFSFSFGKDKAASYVQNSSAIYPQRDAILFALNKLKRPKKTAKE